MDPPLSLFNMTFLCPQNVNRRTVESKNTRSPLYVYFNLIYTISVVVVEFTVYPFLWGTSPGPT